MNTEDYKIDVNTIDEQKMLSRPRSDWENERLRYQGEILRNTKMKEERPALENALNDSIEICQRNIDYIDEVLDRWYSDMCIRCAHKTPVETYCARAKNCTRCLNEWVNRALSKMSDEDLEAMDKQLTTLEGK